MPKLIVFEDEHLLVVNKPAGWNTHSPAPYAGEGVFDWLRHREPRWAKLAIMHRLDKETSGVLVFGKTAEANRSLTQQFATRSVRKTYVLLTDRPVQRKEFTVTSAIVRAGAKYVSRPVHAGNDAATTRFSLRSQAGGLTTLAAEPLTGRTHQIRVHAASEGLPILGDALYGGSPAARVCLHAESLALRHPATKEAMLFSAPAEFAADVRSGLREAIIDPTQTNAYRLIHGASEGWPGWYVERLGDFLLSLSEQPLSAAQKLCLVELAQAAPHPGPLPIRWGEGARRERVGEDERAFCPNGGVTFPLSPSDGERAGVRGFQPGLYHKRLDRQVRRAAASELCPEHVAGPVAPERFVVRENGVQFELSFSEGYSVGLFLDQRDNRRRFLMNHVAAEFPLFAEGARGKELLNAFAYTCGFSVCAATAGMKTTSLDLSKKYLEWGRRNFALNQLDPAAHDFIYGDAFEWLRRLAKKGRQFDVLVLDPPTFSQSKERGVFRAEKDFGTLVKASLPLLRKGGILFASTNAARLEPEEWLAEIEAAVPSGGRRVVARHFVPQPPDFPISAAEPAYLKTVWLRLD
ncbi:MAG: class I SAM-dependent methyltransferase [Verrucomicrobia bacterium]|nr:class I SAM-dependent methyltransferase [Verrucomicrobiota bacterium]